MLDSNNGPVRVISSVQISATSYLKRACIWKGAYIKKITLTLGCLFVRTDYSAGGGYLFIYGIR